MPRRLSTYSKPTCLAQHRGQASYSVKMQLAGKRLFMAYDEGQEPCLSHVAFSAVELVSTLVKS